MLPFLYRFCDQNLQNVAPFDDFYLLNKQSPAVCYIVNALKRMQVGAQQLFGLFDPIIDPELNAQLQQQNHPLIRGKFLTLFKAIFLFFSKLVKFLI